MPCVGGDLQQNPRWATYGVLTSCSAGDIVRAVPSMNVGVSGGSIVDGIRDFFSFDENRHVALVRIWVVLALGVALVMYFFADFPLSKSWTEFLRWIFLIWLVAEIGHAILVSWERRQDRKDRDSRWS